MKVYSREISPWLIWLSLLAVLLISVGIFFFYTFLRQGSSELIDVVPNDAVFLVEVNDHQDFETSAKRMQPAFDELFVMDAYPAFKDIYQSLSQGNHVATISAHPGKETIHLLYNVQIDKVTFRKLLKKLNIDPNNNIIFEKHKIYTYGTSFKSLKFVYFNHVLSVSDDLEIIKKALVQHRHPKNLLSEKEFKSLYALSQKNQKQSWIIFNNKAYLTYLDNYFEKSGLCALRKIETLSDWSAFQIRTTENELFLSGYMPTDKIPAKAPKYELPAEVIPPHVMRYVKCEGDDYAATYVYMYMDDQDEPIPFMVLEEDSLHPVLTKLNGEDLDAFKSRFPDGIYPVDSILGSVKDVFQPRFVTMEIPKWTCCTFRNNYYVLAENRENLQQLGQWYQKNTSLLNNHLYQFSKNNLPAKNLEEYTLFNNDKGDQLMSVLSMKGRSSYFGTHLKAFSLYCTETTDCSNNLIPINLYFLFNK
ncbi:MAG: hypothetical protein IKU03_06435 [Bacteroidales bacterium]|nr:hypothetical protein [Bacteroidales bacterium]